MSEHAGTMEHEGGVEVTVRLAEAPVVEAAPESEPRLTWEHFDARAEDIGREINRHRGDPDPLAGRRSAHEAYVVQEEDPMLQRFGKLVVMAGRAREEQERIYDLQGRGERTDAEDQELERSTRIACAYNQMVGAMVADDEEAMPRPRLVSWLSEAVGGDDDWAAALMAGVATERAAEKLLWEVPGMEGVMHGDLDQDLLGKDLLFDTTPSGHDSLDVKSQPLGNGRRPVERERKTGRIILNIDPKHMDRNGYAVRDPWRRGYIDELTMKLMK